MPFLIYTSPRIAKNLLTFRYHMLPLARQRAKELGHRGAMFPWRTINGEEASAFYAAGTAQYHINADIMYALRKYVLATGDEQFLERYGAEMLVETARLWVDLGFFSATKGGKFCINAVTGPDEYNTVVNNNAYTNLMARENLRYAVETVRALRSKPGRVCRCWWPRPDWTTRKSTPGSTWRTRCTCRTMRPYGSSRNTTISWIDAPWDFANTPEDRYPLLLFYHPLNIYRKQVSETSGRGAGVVLVG